MPLLQKIKMYYDPLGRVVKTVNPDNSEQRVVYGTPTALNTPSNITPSPWVNYSAGWIFFGATYNEMQGNLLLL